MLWDLLPSGPRLGGAPANFALLSARLGESSALASCVGDDDLGRETLARMREISAAIDAPGGQDFSNVQTSTPLPTGTVGVELDDAGRPRYSITFPAAWDEIELSSQLLELAKSAGAICFGTLAQRHEKSRRSIRAFVEAAGAGCARVCDLNLRAPYYDAEVLRWSMAHADVLKVSDEELPEVARVLGEPAIAAGFPHSGDDAGLTQVAFAAARALLSLAPQCRMAAITLGPHGSVLADRDDAHRHEGFPVEVADTIGAGDAFTAGMIYAYRRGASLSQINTAANLCGSYVASQPGATPPLPASLLESIRDALA